MTYVPALDVRRAATQMTVTALPDPDLDKIIERASRMFDLVCGVEPEYFEAAAAGSPQVPTNKTIYGDGTNYLRLPPYVPGSLDTTITLPTGYTAPTFAERDGFLVQVSSDGVAPPGLIYMTGWYPGVPITLSAVWGYESTPADVQFAIIELVINLWREVDPVHAKLVNIEGQPLRERLPPRVREICQRYRVRGVAFV